jgi:hypothetical protein
VFGAGRFAATGQPDTDEEGIVCFITVAGFLNGEGFEKMRDDLRRTCSDIWLIDCSPEGYQPDVPTRIFQGVQQPVCIVLAARKLGKDEDKPAAVRFYALPKGTRAEKFVALAGLSLDAKDWIDCPSDWRAPFLPEFGGKWGDFTPLGALFGYDGSGVMPGRTWIIAPDKETLEKRWARLIAEKDTDAKAVLFHPHLRKNKKKNKDKKEDEENKDKYVPGDKYLNKPLAAGLVGHEFRSMSVDKDSGKVIAPTHYAFRSLDRQWIIPDARLINQSNPTLWKAWSDKQIFVTGLDAHSLTSGPALTLCGTIPDLHHYKGSFGGRVYPLWANAQATQSNVRAEILQTLAKALGAPVTPEDVMAYIAAVMAHPAFTARFKADLVRPGLRLPLTADKALFDEAVALGREVVWLHCYGERFVDAAAGRPKGPPRLPENEKPTIPADGAIPGAPEPLPEIMAYDAPKLVSSSATVLSTMSRRPCGITRFPVRPCSTNGSATAGATAPSP